MKRYLGRGAACAMLAFVLALGITQASALDAFWHGVRSNDWNHGIHPPSQTSNWYSEKPPNGLPRGVPNGTATFAAGAMSGNIFVENDTEIKFMKFPANTPLYFFSIQTNKTLLVTGGLLNSSATQQWITIHGTMTFAGPAKVTGKAKFFVERDGQLNFRDASRGGSASVQNAAGQVVFSDRASADRMVITNIKSGIVALTSFTDRSTGGKARIANLQGNILSFDRTTGPAGNRKVTAGSINNSGSLNVGLTNLALSDSFKQDGKGKLRIQLTRTGGGRIVVAGNASVGGILELSGARTLRRGMRLIVQATGRVSGRFAKLVLPGFPAARRKPILVYTAKGVSLKVF
jgi:hypothetical protein